MGAPTAGCLDAPPTYSAPVQSAPIILGNQVDPPTHVVQPVILTSKPFNKTLTVPFRSIDGGEDLVAVLWVDYDPNELEERWEDARGGIPADSRPLDEQLGRAVTFEWDAARFLGCRSVTVHVAHESTYPIDPKTGTFEPGKLPAKDQFDIGQVTWFFDVQDPSDPSPKPICWGRL
jgi:hypothetical protein